MAEGRAGEDVLSSIHHHALVLRREGRQKCDAEDDSFAKCSVRNQSRPAEDTRDDSSAKCPEEFIPSTTTTATNANLRIPLTPNFLEPGQPKTRKPRPRSGVFEMLLGAVPGLPCMSCVHDQPGAR